MGGGRAPLSSLDEQLEMVLEYCFSYMFVMKSGILFACTDYVKQVVVLYLSAALKCEGLVLIFAYEHFRMYLIPTLAWVDNNSKITASHWASVCISAIMVVGHLGFLHFVIVKFSDSECVHYLSCAHQCLFC